MKTSRIIASILAGLVGLLSVFSGSMVLLGLRSVDYTVLDWLVIINVVLGILSLIAAYLIGKQHAKSNLIIKSILFLNLIIFFYLFFFDDRVAVESIKAMVFRIVVWAVILLLILLKKPKTIRNK
ncbi:hypothetical protein KCTC52924_01055 [Arenibacter antarcticus]|uniref:Uncharacterized protein n=1 Tax=Arenibacter antarcticus TaxID=2040469 RepID=A0ABW5VBS9_9FLAO|nr:hypothetical protein [Arenibacter sp. H213]MCM4167450.1 hypothetical protein [Arenibacter sp. H213]